MWKRFRGWLSSFNITAGTVFCGWVALTVLYVENQAFHDYVYGIFARFPRLLQEFVVGIVIPIGLAAGKWRKSREATS